MNLWTRLGVSVSFSALFYILMAELLQRTQHFDGYRWHIGLGLAGAGLLLVVFGPLAGRRAGDSPPKPAFFSLRFCGCLLIIFGVISFIIVPAQPRGSVVQARTLIANATLPPEPTLPEVKLQGVIYRLSRPSVIIRGKPFFVGDTFEGARIVAIATNAVTLACNGVEKTVAVPELRWRRAPR